jgi:hypothetical protein
LYISCDQIDLTQTEKITGNLLALVSS